MGQLVERIESTRINGGNAPSTLEDPFMSTDGTSDFTNNTALNDFAIQTHTLDASGGFGMGNDTVGTWMYSNHSLHDFADDSNLTADQGSHDKNGNDEDQDYDHALGMREDDADAPGESTTETEVEMQVATRTPDDDVDSDGSEFVPSERKASEESEFMPSEISEEVEVKEVKVLEKKCEVQEKKGGEVDMDADESWVPSRLLSGVFAGEKGRRR